jgi:hypothetical protein
MSSTMIYGMPKTPVIGRVREDGSIEVFDIYHSYFGGIEDISGRVAAYVNPSTATAAQIAQALIDAKLMKAS